MKKKYHCLMSGKSVPRIPESAGGEARDAAQVCLMPEPCSPSPLSTTWMERLGEGQKQLWNVRHFSNKARDFC